MNNGIIAMKWTIAAFAFAFAGSTSIVPAAAQTTTRPDVSTPSAQNSGAGISGYSGNKNGPSGKSGTVGSSVRTNQNDPTVRQQDPAKIQGMPGNKSGPPARSTR